MERRASVIRLRPEKEAEYRRLHEAVWPHVLATLRSAGVTNFSIYLHEGVLFSYLEYVGDDFAGDMAAAGDDETMREWAEVTGACQQSVGGDGADWTVIEEVFHLD